MGQLTVDTIKVNSILGIDGKSTPSFYAYDGRGIGDVVTANGSVTNINTILYDTHSGFNTSTFKYTIPVAGLWEFSWGCFSNTSPSVSGNRTGIWKSGNLLAQNGHYGAGSPISAISLCSIGDFIWIQPGSGGATMSYYSSYTYNWFIGYLIR